VQIKRCCGITPGAKVARELAISLVDTASVFEVFVSVVLVGEHFATSPALKPLAACITQLSIKVSRYGVEIKIRVFNTRSTFKLFFTDSWCN